MLAADFVQAEEAFDAYNAKVLVDDVINAPKLVSSMTDQEYIDAISAPRIDAGGRTRQKPAAKRQKTIDVSDDSEASEADPA